MVGLQDAGAARQAGGALAAGADAPAAILDADHAAAIRIVQGASAPIRRTAHLLVLGALASSSPIAGRIVGMLGGG